MNAQPWLQEFIDSAVDPAVALANVVYLDGDAALEAFLEDTLAQRQKVQSYLTAGNARLVQHYSFLAAGAWFATCTEVPYCKPSQPRPNPEKPGQHIKYEQPPGATPDPLRPNLTVGALRRICEVQGLEFSDIWEEICRRDLASGNPQFAHLRGFFTTGKEAGNLPPAQSRSSSRSDTGTTSGQNCQTSGDTSPGHNLSLAATEASPSSVFAAPNPLTIPPDLKIPSHLFWPVWEAIGGSTVITEGFKKALALISLGIPAVALRGVTQWRKAKGSKELHPLLAALAKDGRRVLVAFDQDEKAKTQSDVATQAERLGSAIQATGGNVRFLVWDGALGKGIDDALAALPSEDRAAWLQGRLDRALSLREWRRRATVAKARYILAQPGPVAQRHTEGEYLPTLPTLTRGAVHWLAANMGSGKTYRIGRDWVADWKAAGGVTVVFSPLNSLGQQTAQDWALPHIHDYGTGKADRQALEADISVNGGLVACVNSAHRVAQLIPQDRPLLLVIDEAAQTLTDAALGGTLKGSWADRWEDVIALLQRATAGGAIVLAEDGLDRDTIDLVQVLSGAELVRGVTHTRAATPWPVYVDKATPLNGWRSRLLDALGDGQRILYVTTSQAEGRRLEYCAKELGIEVARIDSETNEGGRYRAFFESPEPWLYATLPQLVILSPSGKTGLSIEGGITAAGAYFDSVWGYFPSLDTDTAMQLLGRYRPPVPRYIWVPAYIQPGPGESPGRLSITNELATEAARYAKAGGFEPSPDDPHDAAIKRYLAARGQRRWAQKVQAADALIDRLEAAAHLVTVSTEGDKSDPIKEQWDEIKEVLAREDSAFFAGQALDETHTWEWANQIIRSTDSTREQRAKAAKVRLMARFPGVDWNCPELWYQAQFCPRAKASDGKPSKGPLAPGAALWAESGHYKALWEIDAKEAQHILGQRLKAAHLLPQNGPKAAIAALFRPLVERLWKAGEVVPCGRTEGELKALALRYRDEIRRYWRLNIHEDQNDTAICNKVAWKFGFITQQKDKTRIEGTQVWSYSITAPDTWLALVAARELALSGGGKNSLEGTNNEFLPTSSPDHSSGPPPLPTEDDSPPALAG